MRLGGGRFNDLNSLKRPGVTLYHRVIASSISDPKPDYDLSQTLLSKTVDAMREMRLSRLTQEAMLIGKEIPVDAIDREIKVASLALYSPNRFGKNVSELACWVQAKREEYKEYGDQITEEIERVLEMVKVSCT